MALRLEFIDDPAGPEAPAAHHIHYFVATMPTGADGRAWYMKTFGATENSRRNGGVPSALLTPAGQVDLDGLSPRRAAAVAVEPEAAAVPLVALPELLRLLQHPHRLPAPPAAAAGPVSNKGTILDRFALEVKGLDAFVKKIEAEGVKVTKPVSTNADGLKTAMIVDGVGNDVELIEGLAGK